MKFALHQLAKALVLGTAYAASPSNHVRNFGWPSTFLETNGVAIGWLPSNGNASEGVTSLRYTMTEINARLGANGATYGMYSHLDSQQYNGYELMEEFDDVVNSGAIFVPSVMPVLAQGFVGITKDVAYQVADVMRKFTERGVRVWLRFGHEMNWYVDPAAEPRYYGTPAEFVVAWQNVAEAVADNPLVQMFWSPNNIGNGSADVLDPWYPGDETVDLVGIDCYPNAEYQDFEYMYKNFYDRYSAGKNKPFAIGETGANATYKEWWLSQLVGQSRHEYPNYVSMSWFEYLKGDDFRLVMAGKRVLEETKRALALDHY
ncbi:CAZyme family GH26 [Trichoderma harzianum]|nr:CAZyme family GH26 [Trichoderma harzianum]